MDELLMKEKKKGKNSINQSLTHNNKKNSDTQKRTPHIGKHFKTKKKKKMTSS